MFAIAQPTTINLSTPVDDGGDPVPFASITFHTPADGDVSKCVMDVTTPDGDVHTVVFNTRGAMVSQDFVPFHEPETEDFVEHPPVETRHPDGDLKTADDTTEADVAWDAPHGEPIREYGSRQPSEHFAAPVGLKPAEPEPQHGQPAQ